MAAKPSACPVAHDFPFAKTDPMTMPAEFAELREREPVARVRLPSGDLAWLVTRYADTKAVLSDWRFSRDTARPDAARMNTAIGFGNHGNPFADPPDHTRWRRLVARAFTARRVERMRPGIQAIVDRLVGAMIDRGPDADLMEALAYPLPITVLCDMLGVPVADQVRFRGWIDDMLNAAFTSERRMEAAAALIDYAKALADAKRRDPADDMLSALVAVRDEDDGRLDDDELFVTVMTLLVAGYKTTAAQIGKGLLTLFRHPAELAAARAHRDEARLRRVSEELLRFTPPGAGYGIARYAVEDVEVGGVLIPAGSTVFVARHSGNRDEAHFPDAERFDIGRGTANQHLTFGAGPAFCVGAPVARMELELAFDALLHRLPGLALAVPEAEVPWNSDTAAQAPERVLITWDGAAARLRSAP
ncbi:cytochrome P450 [Actinomadura rugatobispora]|uniref:Cytochrome P450 n=1 Tax=Actinomadura rugatobispora TaxID=1994 RepID=A0ABW1AFF6_9ACTN